MDCPRVFRPGRLWPLVISQTLKHGIREGAKVAMAPLITDLPIILVSLLVLTRLTDFKTVLGVISIIGGIFVAYLAYGNFRPPRPKEEAGRAAPQSLAKGVAANALSPHPYLFWLTVGGPVIVRGWSESPVGSVAFLTGFFYLPRRRQDVDGLDYRQVQTMAERKGLPGHPVYPGGPFGCLMLFFLSGKDGGC